MYFHNEQFVWNMAAILGSEIGQVGNIALVLKHFHHLFQFDLIL